MLVTVAESVLDCALYMSGFCIVVCLAKWCLLHCLAFWAPFVIWFSPPPPAPCSHALHSVDPCIWWLRLQKLMPNSCINPPSPAGFASIMSQSHGPHWAARTHIPDWWWLQNMTLYLEQLGPLPESSNHAPKASRNGQALVCQQGEGGQKMGQGGEETG